MFIWKSIVYLEFLGCLGLINFINDIFSQAFNLAGGLAPPLDTFRTLGYTYKGLFIVPGGAQKGYAVARRIGFASNSSNNVNHGTVKRYHMNGATAKVGNRLWMVGGRNEVSQAEVHFTQYRSGREP